MVSIIGDIWAAPGSANYELAYWLGYSLVSRGYRTATCGRGIGEAAERGAFLSPGYEAGAVISFPTSPQSPDPWDFRKAGLSLTADFSEDPLVLESDAVIAIGGGPDTLTQLAQAWVSDKLIIAYRVKGWSGRVADRPLDRRLRYPDVPDDQVYGAASENDVLERLELLSKYW